MCQYAGGVDVNQRIQNAFVSNLITLEYRGRASATRNRKMFAVVKESWRVRLTEGLSSVVGLQVGVLLLRVIDFLGHAKSNFLEEASVARFLSLLSC